jgi:hypothetical protein
VAKAVSEIDSIGESPRAAVGYQFTQAVTSSIPATIKATATAIAISVLIFRPPASR